MHNEVCFTSAARRPVSLTTVLAMVGLLGMFVSGCKTDERPESAQFASVVIHGRSIDQIHAAIIDIFHEHQYKAVKDTLSTLVFEELASKTTNLIYGNWLGGRVWSRVKVTLDPIGDNSFRIECHAFLVENKGEVLEEEKPVGKMHRKPFQQMMDDVAKRLN